MAEPDPPPASHPAPLGARDRIASLDALRGFALFGILVMNVPGFARSIFAEPVAQDFASLDGAVAYLRELLFAGKFNLLFGALFGAGFALQFARVQASHGEAVAVRIQRRRLLALLAIGIAHAALLWPGDILVTYAVLGAGLLAARRLSDSATIVLVGICVVVPALLEALGASLPPEAWADDLRAMRLRAAAHDLAFGAGRFGDAVGETLDTFVWMYGGGAWAMLAFFYAHMAIGVFAGHAIARSGALARLVDANAAAPRRRAWRVAGAIALAGGLAWWFAGGAETPAGRPLPLLPALAREVGRAALSAFYALTVLRLAATPAAARALAPLVAAGRMPLSNYLLQTVIGLVVFYGWGLGAWNRTGPLAEVAIAVVCYLGVQLPLSVAWLRRFRQGPVEWLWRRLAYGAPRR